MTSIFLASDSMARDRSCLFDPVHHQFHSLSILDSKVIVSLLIQLTILVVVVACVVIHSYNNKTTAIQQTTTATTMTASSNSSFFIKAKRTTTNLAEIMTTTTTMTTIEDNKAESHCTKPTTMAMVKTIITPMDSFLLLLNKLSINKTEQCKGSSSSAIAHRPLSPLPLTPTVCLMVLLMMMINLLSSVDLVSCQFAVSGGAGAAMGSGGLATIARPSQASGKSIGALSMLSLGAMGAAAGGQPSNAGVQFKLGQSISMTASSGLTAAQARSPSQNNWASASSLDQFYEQLFSSSVQGSMAPPECYNHLIQRYNKWLKQYKTIQNMNTDAQSPTEVVKDVFSRLGQSLIDEECPNGSEGSMDDTFDSDSPNTDPNSTKNSEMVDFVYKALNNAINQLDNVLDLYGKAKGIVDDVFLADDVKEAQSNQERAARLLEHAKQKAIGMAKDWASLQVKSMLQQKGLETMSNVMTSRLKFSGDPLTYLEPMLQASNSNTVELVVNALTDMRFRGALALINRQKPMGFLKCRNDNKKEPYC